MLQTDWSAEVKRVAGRCAGLPDTVDPRGLKGK